MTKTDLQIPTFVTLFTSIVKTNANDKDKSNSSAIDIEIKALSFGQYWTKIMRIIVHIHYNRHCQTAALQRFFTAPVTNCNDIQYHVYGHHFCGKKHLKVACCFGFKNEKKQAKKLAQFVLQPAVLFIIQIWPASKKVWPPPCTITLTI